MSIFFKKKKGNLKENGFPHSATNPLKTALENIKIKTARWLNHKTRNSSIFHQKIFLAIFCVLFSALFSYMLASAIARFEFKTPSLVLTHIGSGIRQVLPLVKDSALLRIEKAMRRPDSLKFIYLKNNNPWYILK